MPIPSFKGQKTLQTQSSSFNANTFHIKQELAKLSTCTIVKVEAVNIEGRISPVGYVDVRPLVDQIDGNGKPVSHGIIYNVPYIRMQGGANAFIVDPQVGDIGMCNFSDRDISRVKETKEPSLPGSKRLMSMADGLYTGGLLNGIPERYIIIEDDGIEIVGGPLVKIVADSVEVETTTASITATASVEITSPDITFNGATAISLISPQINLTAPIVTSTGIITALDFATAVIPSLNAHGHQPGTFVVGVNPVTGKSGAPS